MSRQSRSDPRATRLLRRLRGQVFRASRLLGQPDDPWRRRHLLDSLVPHGERIGSGESEVLRLTVRVPYRRANEAHGPIFPGDLVPRPSDLVAVAKIARRPSLARTKLSRLVVLDTETTGLLDRPETVPFLVGLGQFGTRAFAIEQFFMEEFEGEPRMMKSLARRMRNFRAILSYNGNTFDLPLLRRRFAVHRLAETTWQCTHWDLLPAARQLWGRGSRSCSLTNLEREIFGFRRPGGIRESRIPQVYYDYLGGRRSERLAAVFDHNAQDILTTAALAIVLARTLRDPKAAVARRIADQPGLTRFLENAGGGGIARPRRRNRTGRTLRAN